LSFAAVDASGGTACTPAGGVFNCCGEVGVVCARAHAGSLRGRELFVGGVGGVGGGTAVAIVAVRVVVRANVGTGLPSETGDADGGVGAVWRTRASSLASEATGVCWSFSHSASSIASISTMWSSGSLLDGAISSWPR
jgi:hypothetical protein